MRRITTLIAHKDYLDYLESAVNSAINQTHPNNICVVDDGSDVDIQELIKRVFISEKPEYVVSMPNNSGTLVYAPNTQLIAMKENGGPSRARNLGIELCLQTTDAFMILDADDKMFLDKIEKCVAKMEESWNSIGVVYADYIIDKGDYTVYEYKKPYDKSLLLKECIIHSGSLINSNVFRQVGVYDESFRVCEDYDLWLRMAEKFIAVHIPEALTKVLEHSNNSTNSVNMNIWQESWLRLHKKYSK